MKTGMDRMSVSFTGPQISYLRAESDRLGITTGELVRRIIDVVREDKESEDDIRYRNFAA